MHGQRVVGLREAGVEAVGEHGGGAAEALLGGLHDEHDGAAPAIAQRRELTRRRQLRGDVHVVAAGVHHRHLHSVAADLPDRRGARHARALLERQAVHVGAQQHRGAVAVPQHADDARAADAFRDLHAGDCAQFLRHPCRRLRLVERELRVLVEVIPERTERALVVGRDGLGVVGAGSGGKRGAPRQRRSRNGLRQVELDSKQPARPRQLIGEPLAGLDLHRPGVRDRRLRSFLLKQGARFRVDRKLLTRGGAGRRRVAAVHRQHVRRTIGVAVIVLQLQAAGRARDDPGARMVVTDMKRNAQLSRTARQHVHHQRLVGERVVRCRRFIGGDPACIGLAAVLCDGCHEGVGWCWLRGIGDRLRPDWPGRASSRESGAVSSNFPLVHPSSTRLRRSRRLSYATHRKLAE